MVMVWHSLWRYGHMMIKRGNLAFAFVFVSMADHCMKKLACPGTQVWGWRVGSCGKSRAEVIWSTAVDDDGHLKDGPLTSDRWRMEPWDRMKKVAVVVGLILRTEFHRRRTQIMRQWHRLADGNSCDDNQSTSTWKEIAFRLLSHYNDLFLLNRHFFSPFPSDSIDLN